MDNPVISIKRQTTSKMHVKMRRLSRSKNRIYVRAARGQNKTQRYETTKTNIPVLSVLVVGR